MKKKLINKYNSGGNINSAISQPNEKKDKVTNKVLPYKITPKVVSKHPKKNNFYTNILPFFEEVGNKHNIPPDRLLAIAAQYCQECGYGSGSNEKTGYNGFNIKYLKSHKDKYDYIERIDFGEQQTAKNELTKLINSGLSEEQALKKLTPEHRTWLGPQKFIKFKDQGQAFEHYLRMIQNSNHYKGANDTTTGEDYINYIAEKYAESPTYAHDIIRILRTFRDELDVKETTPTLPDRQKSSLVSNESFIPRNISFIQNVDTTHTLPGINNNQFLAQNKKIK